MKRWWLIPVILVSFFHSVRGQEKSIAFKHLTSEDGLSDNQVTCMLRDRQGFLWIGTKDGLNRYDGRDFYMFRHRAGDSTSLCSNNITCLAYDNDSILWIGTSVSGFCSYDFRTQKFKTYHKDNTPLGSNSINVIRFDSVRNCLWLGLNNGGLQLFHLKTKSMATPDTKSSLDIEMLGAVRSTYDIVFKNSTHFIASLTESLKKLANLSFKKRTPGSPLEPALTINAALAASDGNIWCGAWDNALHQFNDDAKLVQSYIFDGSQKLNYSADEIISLAEDADHILWCGTKNSGLHFFDLKSKTFLTRVHLSEAVASRVYCIYRDHFNRMWVGTGQGLYIHDPLQNQFEVTLLPSAEEKISCKVFDGVKTASGAEYIAAACGLYYRYKGEKQYHFKTFDYRGERIQLTSIHRSRDGNIYIGTNKTIFILDTASIELKVIRSNEKLKNVNFYSLYSSRFNCITDVWVGERNLICGLPYGHTAMIADPERKNLFWLSQGRGDTVIIENLFRKMFVDSSNRMWICGASQGITQFILPPEFHPDSFPVSDTAFHKIFLYEREWKNKRGTAANTVNDVYDIAENNDGSFWLTSEVSGLIRFYPENDTMPFSFVQGSFQSLQGLAKQDEENLWIITSKGLLNYIIPKGVYKLFDSKQGVPQGFSGYFFNDNDSILTAGFEGGFISFNPRQIKRDEEKPQVQVTRLWVMDVASDSLLLNKLVLRYDHNFLKFYLSSNCFTNNDQVTYTYQLTGIDDGWRNNETNPFITYTNLPPGKYQLRFKAMNSDGVESEVHSIPIVIVPPFYETIYFYVLIAATIMAGAYAFYRYRIRQILKIQEVRNKIARDLHDDIGSTIGSINLYSQVANLKLNEKTSEEVKSILDKIETSSREIIDKTGDVVWAANPANDSLKNLLLRIESYSASVLGAAGIQFKIICDEKLSESFLEMDERKNLFLICKEAIHNIIKYAQATEVLISFTKTGGHLKLLITDNGIGFQHRENAYNGNGLKNMKARVEGLKGTLNIHSEQNNGTSIEIVV